MVCWCRWLPRGLPWWLALNRIILELCFWGNLHLLATAIVSLSDCSMFSYIRHLRCSHENYKWFIKDFAFSRGLTVPHTFKICLSDIRACAVIISLKIIVGIGSLIKENTHMNKPKSDNISINKLYKYKYGYRYNVALDATKGREIQWDISILYFRKAHTFYLCGCDKKTTIYYYNFFKSRKHCTKLFREIA